MSEAITSRPYHPDQACERCVFGRGLHAEWCPQRYGWVGAGYTFIDQNNWIAAIGHELRIDPIGFRPGTWDIRSGDNGSPRA